MKLLSRIYTIATTAALVGLIVAYHYESSMNARYESGQLVNASALQEVGYAEDWISAVERAVDK
jgi:hypothetical protein